MVRASRFSDAGETEQFYYKKWEKEMKETLAALFALQQLDSAIETLKKSYTSLDPGREESAAYKAAKAARETAQTKLQAARTAHADNALELKTVETKRAKEDKLLYSGKVTNPKELSALQLEVESLERQVSSLQRDSDRVERRVGHAPFDGETGE